ncbi:85/88 kDa calcium-independent phospholipase A2 [Geodia barretti]|uniref:85/88 kDa calcium-independent phospholipase A2 n=1 Tax=Geodia barretti TaxID=519541 RepID=A0AA35SIU6_GEOBA|nr:85/88 kDa calcium-independent phospholipase A2 [Geodia barretti]
MPTIYGSHWAGRLRASREESSASKESVGTPQSSTNTAADEGTSPQSSPKRKPVGLDSDGKGPQRRKTDRKPTLKTWLLNSLKRKGRRKDNAAGSSRRSVDLETSDFSFHQPSRVSPVVRKKGSPSLELHKTFKRHSFVDVQTVKAAIQEGVDGLPSEIRGGTPLHYYVWTDSVKKDKTDFLVSLLTTAEVEVDCRTEDGNTPLHLAVKKGDVEAVKVLIAFGASVAL